ncbi:DUF2141 domain-containing protein [soil metagenome]
MTATVSAALAAFALMISAPAFAEAPATATTITLNFDTDAPTGKVMVALYDSEAAYSDGSPVAHAMVDVAAGEHAAIFTDLPAGDYAAKTFHDVDGDGKMKTNPFGMPTEPYAFSNNARGNMGPARWDAAHFVADGAVEQTSERR